MKNEVKQLTPDALVLFSSLRQIGRIQVTSFIIKFDNYARSLLQLKHGCHFTIEQENTDFFIRITEGVGFEVVQDHYSSRIYARQGGLYEYLNIAINPNDKKRWLSFDIGEYKDGRYNLELRTNIKYMEEYVLIKKTYNNI